MTAGKKLLAAAVLAVSAWACHQAILTSPLGTVLTLIANPGFIPADNGHATISAVAVEAIGTPVADGTVVQFFSTLGHIDEQGKTNDGVARVNLVADGRSGTASVTAISGAAVASAVSVTIGNLNATLIAVTANPQRIRPNDPRISTITATARDVNGNTVVGVPITFSIMATPLEEELEPGPGPIFTDNNGQAQVTLRTRRDREAETKDVIVTATLATGQTGTVTVTVN